MSSRASCSRRRRTAEVDPTGAVFCFEKGAAKHGPSTGSGRAALGFADVWKKDFFGWEYKGKHKDLAVAFDQLLLAIYDRLHRDHGSVARGLWRDLIEHEDGVHKLRLGGLNAEYYRTLVGPQFRFNEDGLLRVAPMLGVLRVHSSRTAWTRLPIAVSLVGATSKSYLRSHGLSHQTPHEARRAKVNE